MSQHVNDVKKRTAWLCIRVQTAHARYDVCKQTCILAAFTLGISITYKIAFYKFNELVFI